MELELQEALCRVLPTGPLGWTAEKPSGLPPAYVRTTIHVQHLPCHKTSFR